MGPRQRSAAWGAAIAAAVLLVFAPATLGLRTLSRRDTDQLYAPVRTLVVEALRDGRLPLWNPYEGAGRPLFAEGIHSVLHPVSLLGALVAPRSVDFLILGYLVAAALGAFALGRALGASPPAAAGAGLAFALSGYTVSMTGNLVFLAGLSALPWLLAAARAAGAGAPWGPVATALATACALFTGDAQVALVGLALGGLLAADAGGWRGAGRALLGALPGLLLAGVQLAATQALIPNTLRALDPTAEEKAKWALAPARLAEWLVPGLFRGPLAATPTGASGGWLPEVFAESVFLGAPLLVAAWLGAARGPRRTGRLLLAASGVLLWLALGRHLGARQLLDGVPVWNRFRYAEKLMGPLALCLCALGALGVDAFAAARLPKVAGRALGALAIAAAAALLVLVAAPDATRALAVQLLGDPGPFLRSTLAAGLPHLLLALVALLAVERLCPAPRRALALAALVALAPAAAVSRGAHLGAFEARAFASPLRLEADPPGPRLAQLEDGLYDPRGAEDQVDLIARYRARLLVAPVNVAHRVDSLAPYGALEPLRAWSLWREAGREWGRVFRRFGLTHLTLPIPNANANPSGTALALEGATLVQRDDAAGFELWAVPHRPWAFFALRAVAVPGPEEALRAQLPLARGGDDGTVVVEAQEPPPTAPGRVLSLARATESIRIEAEAAGPALLVVQDAFWPGWRATLDGAPTEILAADALVRAVRWPAGRHVLSMTYEPPELRVGLALSAVGALLVLALTAVTLRRRERRGAPPPPPA